MMAPPSAAMPPEAITIHYDQWAFGFDINQAEVTRPADCVTHAPDGNITEVAPTLDHVVFPGDVGEITVVCGGSDRCEDVEVKAKVGTPNTQVTGETECGPRNASATVNTAGGMDSDSSPGFPNGNWICRSTVAGDTPHWYDVKCLNTPHGPDSIRIDRPVGAPAASTTVTHPDGCSTTAVGGIVTTVGPTTDQVSSTATIIEVTCNALDVCQDASVDVATNAVGTTVKGETECGARTASAQASGIGGSATGNTNGVPDSPWVCRATVLLGGSTAVYQVDCNTS